jgi:glycosyltransferase involved in cell wall biosynthesis
MQRGHFPTAGLKIGGSVTAAEEPYVAQLQARLAAVGLGDRVQWHPNVSFEGKLAFFSDLSLFSVPATYGEAFGLYVIEAMAAGVPVVEPRHAAFPELIETTGGGLLCEPDDPRDLARQWERLLGEEGARQTMANRGREAVLARYSADSMAASMESVFQGALNG